MTNKQREIIADNVRAFTHNFGDIRIEKECYGNGFMVFYPANSDSYMYYAGNIHDLNGWLYGCVQGALRVKHIADKAGFKPEY